MKKLFSRDKKEEPKKEDKKIVGKATTFQQSQPVSKTSQPMSKTNSLSSQQSMVQPSSTVQVSPTNSITDPNQENNQGGDKPEEQQEQAIAPSLIEMKKGDYNVHILIEEVKNLISIEENVPPVPRVKMTVFGTSKRTSKMKKACFEFTFNEHFYFDKTNLTAEMLDSEKIVFEIYDNKNNQRKNYFGIYEVDFAYVYGKPGHCMKNTWIGLSNPESDDITKIRGYLKLSISILNENDNRVELEPKEGGDEDCIMPNEIKMKYKQISFYFIRGEDFPDMDSIFSQNAKGKKRCDGYISIKYMGIERKTKVVKMSQIGDKYVVTWYQVIDIPATDPCVSQKICLTVFDEDVGRDDIVGSYEFFIDDIYKGKYNKFDYINIYGSPLNEHSKKAEQMSYNAEIGSCWNGRVFMKCEVREVDSPVASSRDISDNKIISEAQSVSSQPKTKWEIWIRVISALYLPRDKREYRIRATIGKSEIKSDYKPTVNYSIDFNQTIKLTFESINPDKSSLPDLFLYLRDKTQRVDFQNVCFQRIKTEEFYLSQDVLYIKLLPDPVINKVKSMKVSGLLKCKICLFNPKTDKPPDPDEFAQGGEYQLATLGSGNKFFVGNQNNMQFYRIIAIVYMSKELVAAESSGTSDPYVTLTLGEKTLKTSHKNNTMNGVWNEILEFDQVYMDLKDQRTWPVFLLNVIDKNKITKDFPLGYN